MLVYVAGPYSAGTKEERDLNVRKAAQVAAKLWCMGHAVICPHTNSHLPSEFCWGSMEHADWMHGYFVLLSTCDAMVRLKNWESSKGACMEVEYCHELGIPIHEEDDLPPLHPTEVRCPEQVKAFREVLGKMHRTHLGKNNDYSPANILGTGGQGVVVRSWDKVARMLNLLGIKFDIQPDSYQFLDYADMSQVDRVVDQVLVTALLKKIVAIMESSGHQFLVDNISFQEIKKPNFESIADSRRDLAVYSVIGELLEEGKWGR